MGRLVFITGGARSGKNHCAEMLSRRHAGWVCYIATAVIADGEMARRVALQQQRPSDWSTLECNAGLAVSLRLAAQDQDFPLVEYLTLYLARFVPSDLSQDAALPSELEERAHQRVDDEIATIITTVHQVAANVIIASNEVGCRLVPRGFGMGGVVRRHLCSVGSTRAEGVYWRHRWRDLRDR